MMEVDYDPTKEIPLSLSDTIWLYPNTLKTFREVALSSSNPHSFFAHSTHQKSHHPSPHPPSSGLIDLIQLSFSVIASLLITKSDELTHVQGQDGTEISIGRIVDGVFPAARKDTLFDSLQKDIDRCVREKHVFSFIRYNILENRGFRKKSEIVKECFDIIERTTRLFLVTSTHSIQNEIISLILNTPQDPSSDSPDNQPLLANSPSILSSSLFSPQVVCGEKSSQSLVSPLGCRSECCSERYSSTLLSTGMYMQQQFQNRTQITEPNPKDSPSTAYVASLVDFLMNLMHRRCSLSISFLVTPSPHNPLPSQYASLLELGSVPYFSPLVYSFVASLAENGGADAGTVICGMMLAERDEQAKNILSLEMLMSALTWIKNCEEQKIAKWEELEERGARYDKRTGLLQHSFFNSSLSEEERASIQQYERELVDFVHSPTLSRGDEERIFCFLGTVQSVVRSSLTTAQMILSRFPDLPHLISSLLRYSLSLLVKAALVNTLAAFASFPALSEQIWNAFLSSHYFLMNPHLNTFLSDSEFFEEQQGIVPVSVAVIDFVREVLSAGSHALRVPRSSKEDTSVSILASLAPSVLFLFRSFCSVDQKCSANKDQALMLQSACLRLFEASMEELSCVDVSWWTEEQAQLGQSSQTPSILLDSTISSDAKNDDDSKALTTFPFRLHPGHLILNDCLNTLSLMSTSTRQLFLSSSFSKACSLLTRASLDVLGEDAWKAGCGDKEQQDLALNEMTNMTISQSTSKSLLRSSNLHQPPSDHLNLALLFFLLRFFEQLSLSFWLSESLGKRWGTSHLPFSSSPPTGTVKPPSKAQPKPLTSLPLTHPLLSSSIRCVSLLSTLPLNLAAQSFHSQRFVVLSASRLLHNLISSLPHSLLVRVFSDHSSQIREKTSVFLDLLVSRLGASLLADDHHFHDLKAPLFLSTEEEGNSNVHVESIRHQLVSFVEESESLGREGRDKAPIPPTRRNEEEEENDRLNQLTLISHSQHFHLNRLSQREYPQLTQNEQGQLVEPFVLMSPPASLHFLHLPQTPPLVSEFVPNAMMLRLGHTRPVQPEKGGKVTPTFTSAHFFSHRDLLLSCLVACFVSSENDSLSPLALTLFSQPSSSSSHNTHPTQSFSLSSLVMSLLHLLSLSSPSITPSSLSLVHHIIFLLLNGTAKHLEKSEQTQHTSLSDSSPMSPFPSQRSDRERALVVHYDLLLLLFTKPYFAFFTRLALTTPKGLIGFEVSEEEERKGEADREEGNGVNNNLSLFPFVSSSVPVSLSLVSPSFSVLSSVLRSLSVALHTLHTHPSHPLTTHLLSSHVSSFVNHLTEVSSGANFNQNSQVDEQDERRIRLVGLFDLLSNTITSIQSLFSSALDTSRLPSRTSILSSPGPLDSPRPFMSSSLSLNTPSSMGFFSRLAREDLLCGVFSSFTHAVQGWREVTDALLHFLPSLASHPSPSPSLVTPSILVQLNAHILKTAHNLTTLFVESPFTSSEPSQALFIQSCLSRTSGLVSSVAQSSFSLLLSTERRRLAPSHKPFILSSPDSDPGPSPTVQFGRKTQRGSVERDDPPSPLHTPRSLNRSTEDSKSWREEKMLKDDPDEQNDRTLPFSKNLPLILSSSPANSLLSFRLALSLLSTAQPHTTLTAAALLDIVQHILSLIILPTLASSSSDSELDTFSPILSAEHRSALDKSAQQALTFIHTETPAVISVLIVLLNSHLPTFISHALSFSSFLLSVDSSHWQRAFVEHPVATIVLGLVTEMGEHIQPEIESAEAGQKEGSDRKSKAAVFLIFEQALLFLSSLVSPPLSNLTSASSAPPPASSSSSLAAAILLANNSVFSILTNLPFLSSPKTKPSSALFRRVLSGMLRLLDCICSTLLTSPLTPHHNSAVQIKASSALQFSPTAVAHAVLFFLHKHQTLWETELTLFGRSDTDSDTNTITPLSIVFMTHLLSLFSYLLPHSSSYSTQPDHSLVPTPQLNPVQQTEPTSAESSKTVPSPVAFPVKVVVWGVSGLVGQVKDFFSLALPDSLVQTCEEEMNEQSSINNQKQEPELVHSDGEISDQDSSDDETENSDEESGDISDNPPASLRSQVKDALFITQTSLRRVANRQPPLLRPDSSSSHAPRLSQLRLISEKHLLSSISWQTEIDEMEQALLVILNLSLLTLISASQLDISAPFTHSAIVFVGKQPVMFFRPTLEIEDLPQITPVRTEADVPTPSCLSSLIILTQTLIDMCVALSSSRDPFPFALSTLPRSSPSPSLLSLHSPSFSSIIYASVSNCASSVASLPLLPSTTRLAAHSHLLSTTLEASLSLLLHQSSHLLLEPNRVMVDFPFLSEKWKDVERTGSSQSGEEGSTRTKVWCLPRPQEMGVTLRTGIQAPLSKLLSHLSTNMAQVDIDWDVAFLSSLQDRYDELLWSVEGI
ncbi:hypothetical protein BLNAU_17303 [Blattamonas nauphoetae]|uniref:Uncharacterized protein n=1 Tax=Blattamonas nauphoetae TaxID=2049346 RepID=A0ABQ9XA86_9EUKA|nr:hypothetical protein BLNAU_17303 [Blattamonas nauphoetae]